MSSITILLMSTKWSNWLWKTAKDRWHYADSLQQLLRLADPEKGIE
jgi:hypothetical protein